MVIVTCAKWRPGIYRELDLALIPVITSSSWITVVSGGIILCPDQLIYERETWFLLRKITRRKMSFYAWKCTYFKHIISDNFTLVDFLCVFVKLTSCFIQIPTISDKIIQHFCQTLLFLNLIFYSKLHYYIFLIKIILIILVQKIIIISHSKLYYYCSFKMWDSFLSNRGLIWYFFQFFFILSTTYHANSSAIILAAFWWKAHVSSAVGMIWSAGKRNP